MKMTRTLSIIGISVLLSAAAGISQAREPIHDLSDLAKIETKVENVSKTVMPATVALISEANGSSGSGIITTPDGLILTAAHVVQGMDELTVVFTDGMQVKGKVLGANYSKDIAMVKIEKPGPWPHVPMGNSRPLEAGDWVIALGHSAGFNAARTPPVRFGRVISKGPGNFLTTDCTLIGGDSGGPLFDLNGKIVGINSSIGTSLTNNNHAGIDGFRQDWDRLLSGEAWGELQMNPFMNPEMPVLGIGAQDGRGTRGVIVGIVAPGSPAAAAGVRPGDLIQAIDGKPVKNFRDLTIMLAKQEAGDKINLKIQREDASKEFKITLARREDIFETR